MDGKKFKTLPAFLKFHSIKKGNNPDNKQSTHTRIGGKDKNGDIIYGGNYSIDTNDLPEFYKLYHKHVFVNGQNEYLTETQDLKNGGTLFVDIDMRFEENITTRQFDVGDITSIIELYCEAFKEIFKFTKKTEFPVYLFKKDNVVLQEGKETKDGLHIAFGLQMKHDIQQLIRNVVIQKETDEMHIFGKQGLNCINSPGDIFDECISIGRNNWQVWGSRKPGCEAYELKYKFIVTFLPDDKPYSLDMVSIDDVNIKELLPIISTKDKTSEKLTEVYDRHKSVIEKMKTKKNKQN